MIEFGDQFGQGRNMVITFDHRGDRSDALERSCVKLPDLFTNRMIMGIDHVVAVVAVPGQMDLPDLLRGQGGHIGVSVEAVIARTDIDVVDVEQDAASAATRDFAEEMRLLPSRRWQN